MIRSSNLRITRGMRTHRHTNDTQRAIGYVRVSTQEQATDGVSLDVQRDKLRAYCKLHGLKLIDTKSDEGYSGSTLERPGLQAALQMIRRGRDSEQSVIAKIEALRKEGLSFLPLRYDRETAMERAKELRAEGLSLREVGLRLRKERLVPLRGGIWHPAQWIVPSRSSCPVPGAIT